MSDFARLDGAALDAHITGNYGEDQETAAMATVRYYFRPIDAWNGVQNVTAVDGVVVSQELMARQGYYTGDGNPEFIGKPVSILRGKGFKRSRAPQVFNSVSGTWQNGDPDDYWTRLEAELSEEFAD